MSKQLFTDGDVIEKDGVKLECVFVSYREADGEKEKFTYSFREQAEVEQERKDAENPAPEGEAE